MISILKDPLFQVETSNGDVVRVGLTDLFQNAHLYRDLVGRTPTGRVVLLRLCMAFLEDALHPEDIEERSTLFSRGELDAEQLHAYFAACERNGNRFLLDDAEHPFMQSAYDEALDRKALKSIAKLFIDLPSGNSHIHLDHRLQVEHAVETHEAFEALLETYMFCPAGLDGPSGANNTPPLYAFIHGRNLFETLVLNLVSQEELENIPLGEGDVPWRNEAVVRPREGLAAVTFLGALTLRPRRICLIFDDDGLVRNCYYQAGQDFRGDERWMDPHVPYRFIEKDQRYASVKGEWGRQLWRDAGTLLAALPNGSRQPLPLCNMADMDAAEENDAVAVEMTGLITDQASCIGWAHELLRLPEALLKDPMLAQTFRDFLRISEEFSSILTRSVFKEFKTTPAEQAGEHFLQSMHALIFGEMVNRILTECSDGPSQTRLRMDFGKKIFTALCDALNAVVNHCGSTVEQLKKQGAVRKNILGVCVGLLKKEGLYE